MDITLAAWYKHQRCYIHICMYSNPPLYRLARTDRSHTTRAKGSSQQPAIPTANPPNAAARTRPARSPCPADESGHRWFLSARTVSSHGYERVTAWATASRIRVVTSWLLSASGVSAVSDLRKSRAFGYLGRIEVNAYPTYPPREESGESKTAV